MFITQIPNKKRSQNKQKLIFPKLTISHVFLTVLSTYIQRDGHIMYRYKERRNVTI